jgi:hypothetical protein
MKAVSFWPHWFVASLASWVAGTTVVALIPNPIGWTIGAGIIVTSQWFALRRLMDLTTMWLGIGIVGWPIIGALGTVIGEWGMRRFFAWTPRSKSSKPRRGVCLSFWGGHGSDWAGVGVFSRVEPSLLSYRLYVSYLSLVVGMTAQIASGIPIVILLRGDGSWSMDLVGVASAGEVIGAALTGFAWIFLLSIRKSRDVSVGV